MKFVLLLRDDPKTYANYSPEQFQQLIEKYKAWAEMMGRKGLLESGRKLKEGGKVLTRAGGKLSVKDGPYGETKEIVGGFYLIKADSYEHAVELCREHPSFATQGAVEIREIDFMGGPEI